MDIQLIQPERSKGYCSNSRSACYMPLGLLSIATYLQECFSDFDVEVFDGEIVSNEEIITNLKPGSLVGIETKTPNYESALEIAYAAKQIGCKVILGGVYASAIPQTILKHRGDIIDYVVVGYGERVLKNIVERDNNVKKRGIIHGYPDFNNLPMPDRSRFLDIETYIDNFKRQHPSWNSRTTNIFTHMGCLYRCLFCSRQKPERGIYFRNPQQIWEEISLLVREYSIDSLVDFSDGITQDLNWLKLLVDLKPAGLNPSFHVFSTAEAITHQSLELLKQLNVHHVFVGVESGDETLASNINKGKSYSPQISLEAITHLSNEGIGITPSFVLGLPGESKKTLERTWQFAQRIKDVADFKEIFCCGLIPFPGSRAFSMLEDRMFVDRTDKVDTADRIGGIDKICDTDIFDPEELKKLWVERFCEADYETINEYVDKILSLGEYRITIRKGN